MSEQRPKKKRKIAPRGEKDRRQAEAWAMLEAGLSHKEIAAQLACSPKTIQRYARAREELLKKAGVPIAPPSAPTIAPEHRLELGRYRVEIPEGERTVRSVFDLIPATFEVALWILENGTPDQKFKVMESLLDRAGLPRVRGAIGSFRLPGGGASHGVPTLDGTPRSKRQEGEEGEELEAEAPGGARIHVQILSMGLDEAEAVARGRELEGEEQP